MKYLRKLGHFAERLAKAGSNDEGDIVTIIAGQTYILECKNRKCGLPVNPPAFVIVKRRQHGVEKAWVIQDLDQWLQDRSK